MSYAYNKIVSCINVGIIRETIKDLGLNEISDAAKKDKEYWKAADLV